MKTLRILGQGVLGVFAILDCLVTGGLITLAGVGIGLGRRRQTRLESMMLPNEPGRALRFRNTPGSEIEYRHERLEALLINYPSRTLELPDHGTLMVDHEGKAIALGWGWDPAFDTRIDRISHVGSLPSEPLTLLIDFPEPWVALRLEFADRQTAAIWRSEFERLI
ncbi:hypothetical protein EON81_19285 [bacterium]|nr:MAG: hypothetical protein EON81_19285 [bacterium]